MFKRKSVIILAFEAENKISKQGNSLKKNLNFCLLELLRRRDLPRSTTIKGSTSPNWRECDVSIAPNLVFTNWNVHSIFILTYLDRHIEAIKHPMLYLQDAVCNLGVNAEWIKSGLTRMMNFT